MIVCSDVFFDRLEKGDISAIEKKHYMICQIAQAAMGDIPIFYHAQPQGATAPAVFVRIAKMQYYKRLSYETECRLIFEVRYLAENAYDDAECESAMEKLLDAFSFDRTDKGTVFAERTDKGALVKVASLLRWKTENADDNGELMRLLEMKETDN